MKSIKNAYSKHRKICRGKVRVLRQGCLFSISESIVDEFNRFYQNLVSERMKKLGNEIKYKH